MIKQPALPQLTAMKAEKNEIPFRAFEDLTVGLVLPLHDYLVTAEEIIEFANKYDPQTMHNDPIAAKDTPMRGLLASGWHTCAIFMRMQYDSFLCNTSSIVSPGTDKIRWLSPVRPGDVLSGTNTITKAVASKSKPDRGIIYSDIVINNQRNEKVMTLQTMGFFSRRDLA